MVAAAIERLPAGLRQALHLLKIELLKIEEKSLKEAAAISGTTVASLKVATRHAIKSLGKFPAQKAQTGDRHTRSD